MASLTVRGSGDPWLVVHGGPGFNHRYMISALEPLASRRQLVFYDQVGIEDESITYPVGLDGMGKQLADILTEVFPSGPISVIAHSWGTLVLAAAVRKLAAQDLVSADQLRGLLVNPVPFQRSAFDAARINFASRIPPEVFAHALQSAQSDATGLAAMRILLPFYLLKSPQIPLELELR